MRPFIFAREIYAGVTFLFMCIMVDGGCKTIDKYLKYREKKAFYKDIERCMHG